MKLETAIKTAKMMLDVFGEEGRVLEVRELEEGYVCVLWLNKGTVLRVALSGAYTDARTEPALTGSLARLFDGAAIPTAEPARGRPIVAEAKRAPETAPTPHQPVEVPPQVSFNSRPLKRYVSFNADGTEAVLWR